MKKFKRLITLGGLLSLFVILAMISSPLDNTSQILSDDNLTQNDLNEKENLDSDVLPVAGDVVVSSWWNESYKYRVRVEVLNPLGFTQTMPINFEMYIVSGRAHKNSIRVVKYDSLSETWAAVPKQLLDTTLDGNFVTKTNITFIGVDLETGTNVYYVYYDPEDEVDTTDYSSNTFIPALSAGNLTVDWNDANGNDYGLSLSEGYGATLLKDKNGKNFHTDNSSSPGNINLNEGLVGYWSFDQDSFEEDSDSGAVPDGEGYPSGGYFVHGSPYFQDGQFGRAAYFGGTDYVAINANEDLIGGQQCTDGFTTMAWVNVQGSGERIITSWDRSEYYRFSIANGDRILWATRVGAIDDMTSVGSVTAGEWHHVTAVYDPINGKKIIYIDGVFDSEKVAPVGETMGVGQPTCYGFIGTGSEASTYDGAVGPANEFDGGMDELRIYSRVLDNDEIVLAMNQGVQMSSIGNITEKVTGAVIAQYDVEWDPVMFTPTQRMRTYDNMTFYRSLNMYQVTRTFKWDFEFEEPQNRMAAWSSMFNWDSTDTNPTTKDYYFYDGLSVSGHSNTDFTAENYTVLYDYDGDNDYTALGLFISDKKVSQPGVMNFDSMTWRVDVSSGDKTINFIPGNDTDIDTGGTASTLYVTINFWEYIRSDYINSPFGATSYFENIYNSLTTPLTISNQTEEEVFYNVQVNIIDDDDLAVNNVNVTLLNSSNDYYINSSLTDSSGRSTFYHHIEYNYTVNLTYNPYSGGPTLWLGTYNLTVNSSETTSLNTYVLNCKVNMSSLVLNFIQKDGSTPLIGAVISFKENNSINIYSDIGTITTDNLGNVTFRWANYSESSVKIDFDCLFLGTNYQFNLDNGTGYSTNLSVSIEDRSYIPVYVQIADFETNLTVNHLTVAPYTFGKNLNYHVNYTYTEGTTTFPIAGATVHYKIEYHGATYGEGDFAVTDGSGISSNVIDYISAAYPLQTNIPYTMRITVSKSGFTPMTETQNLQLVNITTSLTVEASTPSEVYWDRNVSISVYFKDEVNVAGVSSASVSYSVFEKPSLNGNVTADGPKGAGWYTIELNSTDFVSTGNYTFIFGADRQNYLDIANIQFKVEILAINTSLTTSIVSIEAYWNENFTLSYRFNDTLLNKGINDGSVKWNLVGNSIVQGSLALDLVKGAGWYSLSINTTKFSYAGVYNLLIAATKDNYVSQSIVVVLNVREIYTLLNGFTTPINESSIYRTESKVFEFEYTYRVGGSQSKVFTQVANASYRTFEWQNKDNASEYGTGELIYNATSGKYILDFDTANRAIGTYSLTIRVQEINFITRVAVIYLFILPQEFDITLSGDGNFNKGTNILTYTANQDESLTITINIKDMLRGAAMLNITVSWIDAAGKTTAFTEKSNGVYEITIVANADAFFEQQLMEGVIQISAAEFTTYNITTQIQVQMPEVFEGFPMFYFLLGVIGVAIIAVSLTANKIIQNARIPAYVKLIEKVKKNISGKKELSAKLVSVTANEEIVEKFASVWEILGLDLATILPNESGSDAAMTDGDMKGGN
jgi:concanavalin A-like lectin/glucanase superfamily protein